MLFKLVLAQSLLLIAAAGYVSTKVMDRIVCTGSAEYCESFTSQTDSYATYALIGSAVIYAIFSLIAYFANKTKNKILLVLLVILEVLLLLGSINIVATNNEGSDVAGLLGLATSIVVLVFCIKAFKGNRTNIPALS